jgi:nifR3 family TIM-barrel protein
MIIIGTLRLESNLFLAPLAGYTNLAFRLVIRRIGGSVLPTTDMVHARGILEKGEGSVILTKSCREDQPLRVQLFGANPDEVARAAEWLASEGVAAVDINMGCPAHKVLRSGAGSAIICDHDKAVEMAAKTVKTVKIPVTVKMRLGWDDKNISAPLLAARFEDVGVAAITIHGRTRAQGFSGSVNLDGIRQVVQAVKRIPVIGNGDITKPEHARQMMDYTGCAGVMIGRGALLNPWIFLATRAFLQGDTLPLKPLPAERVEYMNFHFRTMVEQFGEYQASRCFRKMGVWYAKSLPNGKAFHRSITMVESQSHYDEIVAGQLLPYLHLPEAEWPRGKCKDVSLPVPAGPNSMW